MREISFDITPDDDDLIEQIVSRATGAGGQFSRGDTARLMMDLTACHANGCPLDLALMLVARDADLYHDIHGITRHIDRSTGTLRDGFLPRFSN